MKSPPVAIAIALLAISLVACAPHTSSSDVDLPAPNIDRWTLPLDAYTYDSASLRDYAEALLDRTCLARKGIDWPVPWQPEDREMRGPSFSAGGMRLFNAELAAEHGYHTAPKTFAGFDAWKAFAIESARIASSTPGFDELSRGCLAESRRLIPLPSDEVMYYATSASSEIYAKALSSSTVQSAALEWGKCMVNAGFGGYAATPEQMPGATQVDKWRVPDPATSASTDEKAVASADAACREATGWSDALYTAMWALQVDFVRANAARLIEIGGAIAKDRDALLHVIAENAPSKS